MKKAERNEIIKWVNSLNDEELEKEYYNLTYDTLGSLCESMYDLGYDMADIKEREQYDKFISQKCGLLEQLCIERGIELWNGGKYEKICPLVKD